MLGAEVQTHIRPGLPGATGERLKLGFPSCVCCRSLFLAFPYKNMKFDQIEDFAGQWSFKTLHRFGKED